ncbi:hypothetical protein F5B20DRAFT_357301 [Whalleya microplaca]|nr:hypothetical protein F5B20DRAFT_357301 [Whalleya microplaca]
MATSTVASVAGVAMFAGVARMALLLIGLAAILPGVSADKATTNTMADMPEYLDRFAMMLSLTSSEAGPMPVEYKVAPLTEEAGLNQSNENTLQTFNVRGNIVNVDQSNYSELNVSEDIAYMSCDSNADQSYISPNDILNAVMGKVPKAILLYSTTGSCCSLGGSNLPFHSVWTMTDAESALQTRNMSSESTGTLIATISDNSTATEPDNTDTQGGNNSAVAMSILYSITGLITLLFLIIIATGAIRAHRHPERYGPRASYGGRPRQSRARGLARAVLETLPIVKFGDPSPRKPDLETELESGAGNQPRTASPVQREASPDAAEQGRASTEAATGATPEAPSNQPPTAAAPAAAAAVSGNSNNDPPADDEHLGCSICTEDFTVGQDVRVLPCDHKFHPQCVDPWLVNVSGTCPLCRLDLRPHDDDEANDETEQQDVVDNNHLAPVPEEDVAATDATHRRRVSRLLDWNRLRHASVDERIQALRQYRQSQQGESAPGGSTDDHSRHVKLSDRLREKFHIRTRSHPPSDSPSTS